MTSATLNPRQKLSPKKNHNKGDFSRIFESKAFWAALILLLFATPLYFSFQKIRNTSVQLPPSYGSMGNFELTNQNGRIVTQDDFRGSVLLVNFIFTSCTDTCPMITKQMAKVQSRLKATAKTVQLVSISVNPSVDTPEVLKNYGKQYGADSRLWSFLTGDYDKIRKLVVDQLKTPIEEADPEAGIDMTHSESFILVDQAGQIRGFRPARNDADINMIVRDLAILVNSFPDKAPPAS